MIPQYADLLLKQKIKLYDNVAKFGVCEGRLLAELEVYPVPRLTWEFEILGNFQEGCKPNWAFTYEDSQTLEGYLFTLEQLTNGGFSSNVGPQHIFRGGAARAIYGYKTESVHSLTFYLPNLRMHQSSNQKKSRKYIKHPDEQENRDAGMEGLYVDAKLDETWRVKLITKEEARVWLDPNQQNRGSLLTTFGELYQLSYNAEKPEARVLCTMTFEDGVERINTLSSMLSFANGGDAVALFVGGGSYGVGGLPRSTVAAQAQAYRTRPLEQLGKTWVSPLIDLEKFAECFSAFERMMQQQYWKETYRFVLSLYSQVINPDSWSWTIDASLIGQALERLAFAVLVEEEPNPVMKEHKRYLFTTDMPSDARGKARKYWKSIDPKILEARTETAVKMFLEKIGLTKARGHNDVDYVRGFLDMRNDAVHPRPNVQSDSVLSERLSKAVLWVEEALLWRLGYEGKYKNRTQEWDTSDSLPNGQSMQEQAAQSWQDFQDRLSKLPRYDLTTRDPSW